jgi:hypothetical protein
MWHSQYFQAFELGKVFCVGSNNSAFVGNANGGNKKVG